MCSAEDCQSLVTPATSPFAPRLLGYCLQELLVPRLDTIHRSQHPIRRFTGVLITPLEKQLKGRQFSSDAEVIAAVETWLDGQPSELFLSGLQRLEFGRCSLFPFWSG